MLKCPTHSIIITKRKRKNKKLKKIKHGIKNMATVKVITNSMMMEDMVKMLNKIIIMEEAMTIIKDIN